MCKTNRDHLQGALEANKEPELKVVRFAVSISTGHTSASSRHATYTPKRASSQTKRGPQRQGSCEQTNALLGGSTRCDVVGCDGVGCREGTKQHERVAPYLVERVVLHPRPVEAVRQAEGRHLLQQVRQVCDCNNTSIPSHHEREHATAPERQKRKVGSTQIQGFPFGCLDACLD